MLRRLVFVLLCFNLSCSRFTATPSALNLPLSFFTAGDSSLIPSSDKLSGDCAGNKDFDACIYMKNPVAQEARALTSGELEGARRFGVKIRGLNATGYLENNYVQVLTLNSERIYLGNLSLLKAPYSEQNSFLEQTAAYYWANRTMEYLSGRVGPQRLPLTRLKIFADDAFTGYASTRNSIHLEKAPSVAGRALSGDIVVQLLGQALAQDLASRALFPGSSAQHKTCALNPHGCCTTENGCSQALASGFGDYVTAMMFPGSPRLGETASGSADGQPLCGLKRDLTQLAGKTKAEVYAACTSTPGLATLMGSWYASQWWKIRSQAETQEPGAGASDIDKIFFDHARAWNGTATFTQAKASALAAAAAYKNGKYTALISSALP